MKKTAVDFLSEKYMYVTWLSNRDEISAEQGDKMRAQYLAEAKEMEKEQSIEIPSDEEIEKILYYRSNAYYEGFYAAITMLRNKIKEGNI
jgi:hypothetical protein